MLKSLEKKSNLLNWIEIFEIVLIQVCKTTYEKKCKPSYNYGQVIFVNLLISMLNTHTVITAADLREHSQAEL